MSETKNLKLKKHDNPETNTEKFDIENYLNGNWDKIDENTEEINKKIENIQALPVGGTKGQVLTKQSETEGDANWEDIEANEVFVGNEEEAPETAKIIVEEDDFVEGSTLSKAEVYVGAEEPTAGEKVWFNKNKNSIYVRNSNGVYEEFAKKSEEVYSTEEQVIGKWIDGKPLYRKVYDGIALSGSETRVEQTSGIIVQKIYGYFVHPTNKSIQAIGAYRAMDTASTSRVLWDGTYVKVQGGTDWQTGQYTARVIIEYTKTTD